MHSDGKGKGSTFFVELPAYRKISSSFDTEHLVNKFNEDSDNGEQSCASTKVIAIDNEDYSYIPPISPTNSPARPQRKSIGGEGTSTELSTRTPSKEIMVSARKSADYTNSSRKLTILVVDDSSANRKMLTKLLARDGHKILEADDGVKAINIIYHYLRIQSGLSTDCDIETGNFHKKTEDFVNGFTDLNNVPYLNVKEIPKEVEQVTQIDLVLMDNFMIELNGPEAAKYMRSFGFKCPIIGVTGSLDDAAARFLTSGADAILQKPIDVKGIWKTLHSIKYFTGEYTCPSK